MDAGRVKNPEGATVLDLPPRREDNPFAQRFAVSSSQPNWGWLFFA